MKTITLTLATVSAMAVAAPLAAQTWHGDRSQSLAWNNGRPVVADLRMQLDTGIGRGTITRREAMTLRTDLNALARLERTYDRDGISRSESATLVRRSAGLQRMIERAENNRSRSAPSAGWREDGAMDMANAHAGIGHRGDRFSGDLRVGQPVSARQIALPVQYRIRYQDNDRSYYRYDSDRVYQVDRRSGLIMAMFDVSN